jgi:hypothetical protein
LETRAGHTGPAFRALQAASDAYDKAEQLALDSGDPQLFYPGLNRMAIDWVRHAGQVGWTGFDAAATTRVEASLRAKHEIDPDFWTNAGLIEIEVLRALAARDLVKDGAIREGLRRSGAERGAGHHSCRPGTLHAHAFYRPNSGRTAQHGKKAVGPPRGLRAAGWLGDRPSLPQHSLLSAICAINWTPTCSVLEKLACCLGEEVRK